MQGFEAKKRLLRAFPFPFLRTASILRILPFNTIATQVPAYCIYTAYSSIQRNRNPSANRTRVRWLEAEHKNHYTTQHATMQ